MRYQVPQFIEVEDKIFGPLTLKQFIYLAGAAGLSFVVYRIAPFIVTVPVVLIIFAFSGTLAFYKINKRFPFIYIVEAAFKYFTSSKLYIWKKENRSKNKAPIQEAKEYASVMVPKISDSKLKDLTWSLDIKESLYRNTNQR